MTKLRTVPFVDMPGFSYKLANVKVGRSGYQDLADALSQINPALQQFSRLSLAKQQLVEQKQEEDRLAREAEIAKGREAFQLDPSGVSEQLKNLTRKGIKSGVIPENANAPFIIGGLQAQGEVLVNRDYRGQLRSVVETTDDPEVAIAKTKAEFFKRPEFSDPSVRAYAAEVFGKVDDEFRRDVNSRLDKVRTEKSKRAWLELGLPLVEGVVKGEIDINGPEMVGWVNRAAGVFENSHKYAFDELIKPSILELVESGGAPLALRKVKDIENWVINPDTGAKFITAELRDDLATFKRDIEAKDSYFKNKAKNLYTTNKEEVLNPLVTEFKGKLNDGDIITDSYLKDWTNRVRLAGVSSNVHGLDVEETIRSMIELSNKDYYNADADIETDFRVWSTLKADLDKGLDVLEDAQDALERRELSFDHFKAIQQQNGDSDRFNNEVMEGISAVKRLTESFKNQFKDTKLTEEMRAAGFSPATTNAVKDITTYNAHPNTLDTLRLKGMLAWRSKLKETRDDLVKANPNITPQQLDETLTEQSINLYQDFNEEYKKTVISELRTGKYIIDTDSYITVKNLENAIRGIETGNASLVDEKIEGLISNLEFPDNLEEVLTFLRAYKDKIQ